MQNSLTGNGTSGYDEFFRTSDATEVGCHAHARRKFDYALDTDPVRAARLLVLWGQLYDIERQAKEAHFNSAQLLEARQKQAKPILAEIKSVLNEYKDQVRPKSPLGKAITYSLNQWEALNQYVDDPMLEIDNNHASQCTSLSGLQDTSLNRHLFDNLCPRLFTGRFSPTGS